MKNIIVKGAYRTLNHTAFKFSGGEIQVRLDENDFPIGNVLGITAKIKSSDDLMELLILTDALRRKYNGMKIDLFMPYLPYARQDRVCYDGESLSLKVFCDIINSQHYNSVTVWDCHSDVGLALLNNVKNVKQSALIQNRKTLFTEQKYILVSPDAGAMKKIIDVAKVLGSSYVCAEKIRSPATGEITGTKVHVPYEHTRGCNFLIVDDICDGGRTFIELAKVLHKQEQPGTVDLYVTHGIFSKGFEVFRGIGSTPLINHIYVANSFVDDLPSFVTKIGV